jgi:hypothetical protein
MIAFGIICVCVNIFCFTFLQTTSSCYHFSLPNPHPLKSFTSLCSLYVAADLYDSGYAVMVREGHFYIYMSYHPLFSYELGHHISIRDVTPGPLTVTDTCIIYHLTNFEASRNINLLMCYISTCGSAGCGGGGLGNNEERLSAVEHVIIVSWYCFLMASVSVSAILVTRCAFTTILQ